MGVIGAGTWGKNHLRALAGHPEAELVAVCDTAAKVRERVARQYPGVKVTQDPAELLGEVEAVVIASPATTHADLARQAVAAGVPA
ncbi:MAG: Gfo/Idh/MocA family oxidoreductase, partial [Gemmatimonadota bacterium]